ncbi:MerR HTH family regulatory protein [Bacillus sp. OV194]|nr:MerR HTH family regulatory protein [Bacillus sp. OV194]
MYSISEAAKLLEISYHTLRYYEKEQIILPERNDYGEREYGDSHIAWLRFVIIIKKENIRGKHVSVSSKCIEPR